MSAKTKGCPLFERTVYVAGHSGLVGSAILRALRAAGANDVITRAHAEVDLTDAAAVHTLFLETRPQYVFLAAAKVGGIFANNEYPAEFIRENLLIETNVIHEAYHAGVRRLLFLGSSCIYPRDCPQPMKEQYLMAGPLESTNRPYALAKIAGIEMCWSSNRQYGTSFIGVMPTNLYGPNDDFDLRTCHVLPALIRKMHEAKLSGADHVVLWGTGTPQREFLYSDDLGEACVFLMALPDDQFGQLLTKTEPPLINIGTGQDLTIAALGALVADVVGFKGQLQYDPSKPDGTPRKLLDVSRMRSLGWVAKTSLRDGIGKAYQSFLQLVEHGEPSSHSGGWDERAYHAQSRARR